MLDAVMELDQYAPSDWGAEVDYDRWRNRDEESSQWFVHWVGAPVRDAAAAGNVNSEKAQLRSIEKYAMGQDYAGIPYDWAIGNSGTLYRCRGRSRSAATSGDVDGDGHANNYEGEAVLFLVGPGQEVSDAAWATFDRMVEASGYTEVYPHSAAKGTKTDCPGDAIRSRLAAVTGERKPNKPKPASEQSGSNWTEKIVADLGTHRRNVKKDDRVEVIQLLLNKRVRAGLKTDGYFGSKTERAVIDFQQRNRLTPDGIVGPKTWRKLLLG